tara:strand:- start:755 stop:2002 length:1248 start_codon:yes stop_codon:yes gene_type:complete
MFSNYINNNKKSLLTNSFYLYLSHFADYILALFLLPFIARSIGAIEFGKIGLTQTFGMLIILLMEFGSSLMATREVARIKNDKPRLKQFIEQLIIFKIYLIPFVIIASLIAIIFVPIFTENPNYVIIVGIGAIFHGLSPIWYFMGIEKMKKIALSKLFFRSMSFLLIIFFVKSSKDAWFILASFSFSSMLICLYLFNEMIKKTGAAILLSSNKSNIFFGKSIYSFLITIIPVIYQNISVIALSVFVNPIQLGFFYGANRIHRAFNSLFSPISQAFFPIISSVENQNKNRSKTLIKKYIILIFIVGSLFFLTNYFLASTIISILLGSEFTNSKNLLRLFSIVLPLTSLSNALGRQWLMVINKDRFYTFVQFLASLIAFILFLFLLVDYGSKAYPISLIIFETLSILMILIYLFLKK